MGALQSNLPGTQYSVHLASMQERFYVDRDQAQRVEKTALALFEQVCDDIGAKSEAKHWLSWAARVHEIGLSIAHSGFHKHGAYLLQHSDMLGFTRQARI